MFKLKVILFAISIIQFSVCHPISNGSSHCKYENDDNHGSYFAVDCEGFAFHPRICDNLKEDVNISSIAVTSFKNCEFSELSDIFNQFPNMKKLTFLRNNTLPSTDLSHADHLSLFVNIDSNFKTTSSSLMLNATDLEWFEFEGNEKNDIHSISLENPTKLEFFSLRRTKISNLSVDLTNSVNLKVVVALMCKFESIDTIKLPNSVHFMDFSSNKITQLTKRSLRNLANLQTLLLNSNEISKIETETFSQLDNLASLNMRSNRIKEIKRNTLKGLNNLIKVDFDRNQINNIEDGAFEATPKLFVLNLSGNNLTALNQRMFAGLNHLAILQMNQNPIREMAIETFGNLPQMRALEMRSGKLETIDFNAFANLSKLAILDLSDNHISHLVKMIPNAWNTNETTTSTTIQNDIQQLSSTYDFEWTKSLIDIRNKRTGMDFLRNGTLNDRVEKAFIAMILWKFHELENVSSHGLKKLELSRNQLTEVERNIFAEFKNLEKLFLSENPITTLYPESFAGLDALTSLYMDHCKLSSVDFAIFGHLVKLRTLDLSHNQLTTVTAAPLPSINHLELDYNQLVDFPMKKSDFLNLNLLSLENNPLTCSNLDTSFADIKLNCHKYN